MSRPLRIEFPGALYHITARGDRREPIFDDDVDRQTLLDVAGEGMDRFDAEALAYCLMGNHYHFVLHTRRGELSRLMRHVNGIYGQAYNRRHGKVGHVFQGRFKAILVDRDAYLMAVCRYVDLNPVRAGLVDDPRRWRWSSYRAHVLDASGPAWLDTAALHARVLGRAPQGPADARRAARRYAAWVAGGHDERLWDASLVQQIYLGDEAFVERMQARAEAAAAAPVEVPRAQRERPRRTLDWYLQQASGRDDAIQAACLEGGHSMTDVARAMGLSVSRISRIVQQGRALDGRRGES